MSDEIQDDQIKPNPELAADAERLGGFSDPPPEPDPQPAPDPSQAKEIAGAFFMIGQLASPKYPSVGQVYTMERCEQVGAALDPVFTDLGWNISDSKWIIYAGGLFAILGLGKDTIAAIRHDNEIAAQWQEAETSQGMQKDKPKQAPGADTSEPRPPLILDEA